MATELINGVYHVTFRENGGGGGGGGTDPNAVHFTPQTLTDAQKAQARTNIDAASVADVATNASAIAAEAARAAAAEQDMMDAIDGTNAETVAVLPEASASTVGKIYYVGPDSDGEYARYRGIESDGSYSFLSLGSTAMDLTDCATKDELNQLEAKVTDLELPSGSYTQAQARVYDHPEEWCFLLNQTGTGIRKPIWHIGNGVFIDAAGAVISFDVVTPASPTFSPDGGAVVEGTVVTLACSTPDADIYVSTDDGETYTKTSTVTISEAVTLMAYSELEGIRSAVVSKAFTIAVDHNFKFTVKLDTDNAIVYVPVVAGQTYNMTVDWGDGSTTQTYAQAASNKGLSHTYTGVTGDTFQITLRGTAIPLLSFYSALRFTQVQLYSIDNNTLETTTKIGDGNSADFSLKDCSNLVSVCDNANSSYPIATSFSFSGCNSLQSLPAAFLGNIASGITGFSFNNCSVLTLSAEFIANLAAKLGTMTSLYYAFGGCKGSISIPDNFFDNLTDGTVTDVRQMTGGTATGVTGDAKKLYDVLSVKATSGITNTVGCFSGTNLSNRNQVPTAWGGTM